MPTFSHLTEKYSNSWMFHLPESVKWWNGAHTQVSLSCHEVSSCSSVVRHRRLESVQRDRGHIRKRQSEGSRKQKDPALLCHTSQAVGAPRASIMINVRYVEDLISRTQIIMTSRFLRSSQDL